MIQTVLAQRQTKYCQAIEQQLAIVGHATNAELLDLLKTDYPALSATTIHRATARLASRGIIAIAPATTDGSMRYDGNTSPHDHFMCSNCSILRDTNIKDKVVPILESSIGDCSISGQLTISGTCKNCLKGKQ